MYSKAGKSYLQKQYMRVCSFIPSFYKYTSAGIMLKLKVFCRPPGKVTTSSTRGEFPETTPWEDAFSGGCTPTASEILHPPSKQLPSSLQSPTRALLFHFAISTCLVLHFSSCTIKAPSADTAACPWERNKQCC